MGWGHAQRHNLVWRWESYRLYAHFFLIYCINMPKCQNPDFLVQGWKPKGAKFIILCQVRTFYCSLYWGPSGVCDPEIKLFYLVGLWIFFLPSCLPHLRGIIALQNMSVASCRSRNVSLDPSSISQSIPLVALSSLNPYYFFFPVWPSFAQVSIFMQSHLKTKPSQVQAYIPTTREGKKNNHHRAINSFALANILGSAIL